MSCGCKYKPCFHTVTATTVRDSLVASLTNTVDSIRQIATDLGARQYQVSLVWTRWSEGRRGAGVEEIVERVVLLPTPLVEDFSALTAEVLAIGSAERGQVRISEISPRYTEDQLRGYHGDGRPADEDEQFYYEVFFPRAAGSTVKGSRRRFVLTGTPNYLPLKFAWSVNVTRAYDDTDDDGHLTR